MRSELPPNHDIESVKSALYEIIKEHLPAETADMPVRSAIWEVNDPDALVPVKAIKFGEAKEDGVHTWGLEIIAPEEYSPMFWHPEGNTWITLWTSADSEVRVCMTAEDEGSDNPAFVLSLLSNIRRMRDEGKLIPPLPN